MKRTLLAIWRVLTLNCEESARLMSASLDQELPWSERIAFRLHAICCRSCWRFFKQIRFLRDAAERDRTLANVSPQTLQEDLPILSPQARQRIAEVMRKANDPASDSE